MKANIATLDCYTVTRGETTLTLTRKRPPFDARVLLAIVSILALAGSLLGRIPSDVGIGLSLPVWIMTPLVFLYVRLMGTERPTLIEVQREVVIGEHLPGGGPLCVRVDDQTWPLAEGEGVNAMVGTQTISPKNGPSYKIYRVFVVMPNALVELVVGQKEEAARELQALLAEALGKPPFKWVYLRRAPSSTLAFVWMSMVTMMLALVPIAPQVRSFLRVPSSVGVSVVGPWVVLMAWIGSAAFGAISKDDGPALLRDAKRFAVGSGAD